jgi:NAD(P)-dependent dehydrogenase (short-subunit alcohol dehydrogenase family)
MRRAVVTGHTFGLGQAFSIALTGAGWDVVGVSRSNGYALPDRMDEVVGLCRGADLVVNCSHADGAQAALLERTARSCGAQVVISSIAADHDVPGQEVYASEKRELDRLCRALSFDPALSLLLVKISFLPNSKNTDRPIRYHEVTDTVMWWLNNRHVSEITMKASLTPGTLDLLRKNTGLVTKNPGEAL